MSVFAKKPDGLPSMQIDAGMTKTRRTAIATACLEACLPRGLRARLVKQALVILVHCPDDTWTDATEIALKSCLPFFVCPTMIDSGKGRGEDLGWIRERAASALVEGRCIVIMCGGAAREVDHALAALADVTITVAPPSARTLRKLLKALNSTSKRMPTLLGLTDHLCRDLNFDEITMAFRPGLTARDVVRCLQNSRCAKQTMRELAAQPMPWRDDTVPLLQDLHGYGEAKAWGLDLIDDLIAYRKGQLPFTALSARVVLTSEPGLGKTSFVRSLARSTDLPLVASSVASWFTASSGRLDGVLRAIDEVFAEARAKAPAILFFDEIDALPNRTGLDDHSRSYWLPVVTHMLTLLDSAVSSENDNLVIVAATNHADALDPALVRPGRLDRVIKIERPNADAIAGILRQHLGDDLAGYDLAPIAQLSAGATGAELMSIVKKARALARTKDRPLAPEDLIGALAPATSTRTPEVDRVIAVHEAGHAVTAALLMPGALSHVSLARSGLSDGHTRLLLSDESMMTREAIESAVTVLLSGYAAEEIVCPPVSTGSISDLSMASRLLFLVHGSAGLGETLVPIGKPEDAQHALLLDPALRTIIDKELQRLLNRARNLLRENQDALHAVSAALAAERILSNTAIERIVIRTNGEGRHPATRPAVARHKIGAQSKSFQ